MGTPDFAVPILERVAADHDVLAVYTRPDAASGRGSKLLPPPVKSAAERLGIPVRQPRSLRAPDVIAPLIADAPDVIVVAAYGVILPSEVLGIPAHGCVNVHASLLPRHRGAAPIQRAILEGDAETGVSIMQMEAGLDTGPFALSESLPIDDLDAAALTTALSRVGVNALAEVLRRIEAGTVVWTPQDESSATYAHKITREDVALDPSLTAAAAIRRVRASSPQARVRILAGDIDLVALHAVPGTESVRPGSARRTPEGLLLGVADGAVLIDRMRPAGKGSVDGAAWSRGSRLAEDTPWHRA
jgi:methionyl-tRNA formyltransferase